MADIALTEELSDFPSNVHLTDLPESWSTPLKRSNVQQGDFNVQVSKRLGALGVAVFALQQSIDSHSQSVQSSVEQVDQVSRAFNELFQSLTLQMQQHGEKIQLMQQQVTAIHQSLAVQPPPAGKA